jgi:hypothetical protein
VQYRVTLCTRKALLPQSKATHCKNPNGVTQQGEGTPSNTLSYPSDEQAHHSSPCQRSCVSAIPPSSTRSPAVPGEAFMAKHFPGPGHEVEEARVFTWYISNWRKQDKKVTSPKFICGGHRWSAFLHPLPGSETSLTHTQAYVDVPIR